MSRVNPTGILVDYNGSVTQVLRQDTLRASIAVGLKDFQGMDSDLQGADPRDYQFKRLVGDFEAIVGESMFDAEKDSRTYKVKLVKAGGRRPAVKEKKKKELPIRFPILPKPPAIPKASTSIARPKITATAPKKSIWTNKAYSSSESDDDLPPSLLDLPILPPLARNSATIKLKVILPDYESTIDVAVKPSTNMRRVYGYLAEKFNYCPSRLRLSYDQMRLDYNDTAQKVGMQDGDTIESSLEAVGVSRWTDFFNPADCQSVRRQTSHLSPPTFAS